MNETMEKTEIEQVAKEERQKIWMVSLAYVQFILGRVHDNRIKAWKNMSLKERMKDVSKLFAQYSEYC